MECLSGVTVGVAASALLVSLSQLRQPSLAAKHYEDRRSSNPDDQTRDEPQEYVDVPQPMSVQHRSRTRSVRATYSEREEDARIPSHGLSMEEARQIVDAADAKSKDKTAAEVLAALQRGNARFWTGNASRPEKNAFERRSLIMKQFPSVAVLGCSDSRVPVEIVFDQGLGDMFVVRVAGNCLDTSTRASLDYAVHHLSVKVVVVLGHEGCGAVKAAGLPLDQINKESPALSEALKHIKSGLDEERLAHVRDARAHDREAVATNVRRQVEQLSRNEAFAKKIRDREIIVVGAFYEISSGIVDFFLDGSDMTPAAQYSIVEATHKIEC